jgi:hypothetical protein
MSNTRQIQSVQIWTPNGEKSIDTLALTSFFDYHFDEGSGKCTYKLISSDEINGATELFTGDLEIPSNIIQQWGADDTIIWDYVANSLSLTIINNQ